MKIHLIGVDQMAEALKVCLPKFGNKLVEAKDCDVCWIAIDTPVNDKGQGDVKPILEMVKRLNHN
jgi:UDP-N-acetyl-D-mannosaminuronate dehydrogenase